MCVIDWELIYKFTDSIVWPLIFVVLYFAYKKPISFLIDRITKDTEKIEFGGIFTAYFKQLEKLKEKIEEGGNFTKEQAQQLITSAALIKIESIKKLGEVYINASYSNRRLIENQIKEYCIGVEPIEMRPLIKSNSIGHRIAAAIGLNEILTNKKIDPYDVGEIKDFVIDSIKDSNSFLRYESIQLVFMSQRLQNELNNKLIIMKEKDKNSAIRNLIKIYLNKST